MPGHRQNLKIKMLHSEIDFAELSITPNSQHSWIWGKGLCIVIEKSTNRECPHRVVLTYWKFRMILINYSAIFWLAFLFSWYCMLAGEHPSIYFNCPYIDLFITDQFIYTTFIYEALSQFALLTQSTAFHIMSNILIVPQGRNNQNWRHIWEIQKNIKKILTSLRQSSKKLQSTLFWIKNRENMWPRS